MLQGESRLALGLMWKQGRWPLSQLASCSTKGWPWLGGKPICLQALQQAGKGRRQGIPHPHACSLPLNPTVFNPVPAAPCCAAAARAASSSSGALAPLLTVDKPEHLLKAKADGRQTHQGPEKRTVRAESLLPTALLVSQSPPRASSAQSHPPA